MALCGPIKALYVISSNIRSSQLIKPQGCGLARPLCLTVTFIAKPLISAAPVAGLQKYHVNTLVLEKAHGPDMSDKRVADPVFSFRGF